MMLLNLKMNKKTTAREQNRTPDQITGFQKPKRTLRLTDDEGVD